MNSRNVPIPTYEASRQEKDCTPVNCVTRKDDQTFDARREVALKSARASAPRTRNRRWSARESQTFSDEVGGRGDLAVRLLASHLGEPGSISGGVDPRFPRVGIVSHDAAGGRVFSGISRFPRPVYSGAAPYSPLFTLTGNILIGRASSRATHGTADETAKRRTTTSRGSEPSVESLEGATKASATRRERYNAKPVTLHYLTKRASRQHVSPAVTTSKSKRLPAARASRRPGELISRGMTGWAWAPLEIRPRNTKTVFGGQRSFPAHRGRFQLIRSEALLTLYFQDVHPPGANKVLRFVCRGVELCDEQDNVAFIARLIIGEGRRSVGGREDLAVFSSNGRGGVLLSHTETNNAIRRNVCDTGGTTQRACINFNFSPGPTINYQRVCPSLIYATPSPSLTQPTTENVQSVRVALSFIPPSPLPPPAACSPQTTQPDIPSPAGRGKRGGRSLQLAVVGPGAVCLHVVRARVLVCMPSWFPPPPTPSQHRGTRPPARNSRGRRPTQVERSADPLPIAPLPQPRSKPVHIFQALWRIPIGCSECALETGKVHVSRDFQKRVCIIYALTTGTRRENIGDNVSLGPPVFRGKIDVKATLQCPTACVQFSFGRRHIALKSRTESRLGAEKKLLSVRMHSLSATRNWNTKIRLLSEGVPGGRSRKQSRAGRSDVRTEFLWLLHKTVCYKTHLHMCAVREVEIDNDIHQGTIDAVFRGAREQSGVRVVLRRGRVTQKKKCVSEEIRSALISGVLRANEGD
ncbi:hypothetical protein PR048_029407 [Dryococelus australis]|uniref:Uncharacterized protein n=1 Tax=Dryococelus australis TaxID=614101 RepID=A0ABQ9GFP6_9NEOP|nr:hypothetical protein PR048_029407 [Dryococelus australis]